jgi:hypothetical protein
MSVSTAPPEFGAFSMGSEIDETGKQKIIHPIITHSKQRVITKMEVMAAHSRR